MDVGSTFHLPAIDLPGYDPHLWVVLCKDDETQQVVIANLTTLRSFSDTTTIIQSGEHKFVKHLTVVSYKDSKLCEIGLIQEAMKKGLANLDSPASAELLKKIQEGLLKSIFTPKKVKCFFLDHTPK